MCKSGMCSHAKNDIPVDGLCVYHCVGHASCDGQYDVDVCLTSCETSSPLRDYSGDDGLSHKL